MSALKQTRPSSIDRLLAIMARLRDPDGGCPWDIEQTFKTISPHTIEEAYEVVEAIESGDKASLKDELGDLLFQVVFYAQMAGEEGSFDFEDVVAAISDKMIRRHPHVFGDVTVADVDEQTVQWEAQKARERQQKGGDEPQGTLAGVSTALPAQTRALKLQARAARVGFDWPAAAQVLDKIDEELGEVRAELADGTDRGRLEDEIGDLLFACVNLARKTGIDPESALRRCNRKFQRRFGHIETRLAAEGRTPGEATLDEMEALWVEAKRMESRGMP